MIYEKMIDESCKLEEQIKNIQQQIEEFPEGKLVYASNGKGYKWYVSDGHTSVYLPKKERLLAEKLAYKKYLSLQVENMIREKRAIDFYLRHHNKEAHIKEQEFVNSPMYKDLLAPIFKPLSDELNEWKMEPYEKNDKHPENLLHITYSGNVVRSKSEAIIDMFLYKNNIPFRYECMLELGDTIVYPDYTIRHPETGKVYYWEHFGLMDQPSYSKNALSKLQLYISHGIYPSVQLITTYETKESPLRPDLVERIIKHYFL